jgi:4-aminobutyrate aminotransferase-like enzyme
MADTSSLLARRARLLGAKAPLFYDQPLHIVRGEGVWLYDVDGRRYLDAYNNVPLLGHCHPEVVEALARQAATLNIHTRYLHETILDYGERLIAKFDPSLAMILFVCTGSEANDQALRIARCHTGKQGIICTNLTYHGNTTAVDAISPLFYGADAPTHREVSTIASPDTYRAPAGLVGSALTDHYIDGLKAAIARLEASGVGFAGLMLCTIFANEGLPDVPPGFMQRALDTVHAAGGLFIGDEVQAGFGRTGDMWGHQAMGVVPDIVTLGKPMGNGHPLAAVVARADLIEKFRAQVFYFNTFGGNPVSCAVGAKVLDILERDALMDNARDVGAYLRTGLQQLATRHDIIGDIRGRGLWIGIELVTDRQHKTPAASQAQRVINLMKDKGVLMGRIGEFDNVLKIRPPLPITRQHADLLLSALHDVLAGL